MRPYLAIIRDSFHAALASRVLWILLALITIFLVALAPLGLRSEQTTLFRQGDFLDARAVTKKIMQQYDDGTPSPGFQIASKLSDETRELFVRFSSDEESAQSSYFRDINDIIEDLNELLTERELYTEEAWQDVLLGTEARDLLKQGTQKLGEDDLARLNRMLIEVPYEEHFRSQPPKQIIITYFGWSISPPIRVSERRVNKVIEQWFLPFIIGILIGVFAIGAAIIVTSPIIPQMFDPGSLSLLLSKPVSRSLLFLAKFVGGCAFVLINITYLIVGLWLILGLRFGIWNQGLLWCIPIFLFLFSIYYSVSAFSGVIWRNAIVSVIITILFWFVCWIVGITKGVFEGLTVERQKIVRLVQADDTLIGVDQQGATKSWNQELKEWEPTFLESSFGPMVRVLGPIYDAENKTLLAAQMGGRGLFSSGRPLILGNKNDGWRQEEGPELPDSTFALLPDPQGKLLAITHSGVHQLSGNLKTQKKLKVFFMEIPQSLDKPFQAAGPEPPLKLESPAVAAVNQESADLAIYSRGSLMVLSRNELDYSLTKTVEVEADEEDGAAIAFGGATVLLALADGRILNYDAATLKLREQYEPEPHSQPRFATASPDGNHMAIVFHNGRLHIMDATDDAKPKMTVADVRGQDTISAALFTDDNSLMVVDRATRVTKYDLQSFKQTDALAPDLTALEIAYYYAVIPIYTLFPKPSELDNTVQYVLNKEETTDMGLRKGDLEAQRARLRPWAPVRSSLLFVLVVLALACIYIERQDF